MEKLNLGNLQAVGIQGERVLIPLMRQELSREAALVHAAWIVAICERREGEFKEILEAVQCT